MRRDAQPSSRNGSPWGGDGAARAAAWGRAPGPAWAQGPAEGAGAGAGVGAGRGRVLAAAELLRDAVAHAPGRPAELLGSGVPVALAERAGS